MNDDNSGGTRAPWAMRPISGASVPNMSAPGAGASVTRAPWATAPGAAGAAGGGDAAVTRAPWVQGVSVGDPTMQDRLDFNAVAKQHPEYAASLSAAAGAAAAGDWAGASSADAAAAAAAGASPTAATAATPASTPRIYSVPCKLIKTPAYLALWRQTCAYAELTSFILVLNERVRGVKIAPRGQPSRKYSVSPKVRMLVEWLDASREAIASIPPIAQSMRFGNKAFRSWHEARTGAQASLRPMLRKLLGPELTAAGAEDELVPYLQDSFGSVQRIDYGTGHELNFVLALCALNKLGVFQPADYVALVLEVFRAYLMLMQELQSTYWLEPAGSKGAWGLDDYQFLVFLWGSSQLQGSLIQPSDFLKEGVVESHGDSYLFLLGIRFIHRMKRGPFHEHSSFLHHISTLPSWSKANGGLVKMYDAEVLGKHPIVQHVLFGRILKFQKYEPNKEVLGVADAIKEDEAKKAKAAAAAAPSMQLNDAAATDGTATNAAATTADASSVTNDGAPSGSAQ